MAYGQPLQKRGKMIHIYYAQVKSHEIRTDSSDHHVKYIPGIEGDLDLAAIEVGYLGEGLLGEVDCALAPIAARALVHDDLDDDAVAGAGGCRTRCTLGLRTSHGSNGSLSF